MSLVVQRATCKISVRNEKKQMTVSPLSRFRLIEEVCS